MNEPIARLYEILSATRHRVRLRAAARGGATGCAAGAVAALAVGVGAWVARIHDAPAAAALIAVWAAVTAFGAVIGAWRARLDDRELALLADRVLGTDEVFVTALGLDPADPARPPVLAAVLAVTSPPPDLAARLPVRIPRRARWSAVPLALALATLVIPPRVSLLAADPHDPAERLRAEGEALAQRMHELAAEHPELPMPEAGRDLGELAEELRNGRLSEQEARERIAEIARAIEGLDAATAEARELVEAVEQAARALEQTPAGEPLAESLREGDPASTAEAARQLAESLADPNRSAEAAEALRESGEALAASDRPGAREAGEALQRAADQAGDGFSADEARQLQRDLERLAENAAQAQGQRDQAERLRGEAARSGAALGSDSMPPSRGDGSEPGRKAQAGTGHTWDDGGDHAADPGHQDQDRTGDRTGGQTAEDFRALYKSVRRYDGTEPVLAEADGELAKDGRVDELPVRFTAGDETAASPRVALPDSYRQEAARAIAADEVPPGYREAVKSYFQEEGR